ncbi:MAG: GWxTD domain-containing protein [Gemmatimonadales bacterium]|nr:GWxTD domain-containing protein [Gemmatimonadales bacterium]
MPSARRLAALLLPLAFLVACGGPPAPRNPQPRGLDQFFNPNLAYQRLGRLTSGGTIPFIGDLAYVRGQGDTVVAVLALSLENRALAFQKDGRTFVAKYRVDVSMAKAGAPSAEFAAEEVVRVATYGETSRSDESVIWQKRFKVTPGPWRLAVTLRDLASNGFGRAEVEVAVPALPMGALSDPIVAYQVKGRGRLRDTLDIVLNPRGQVSFGGNDSLLVYVEGYGLEGPQRVPFEIRTEKDSVIRADTLRFRGGREVESQVVRLRPDSLLLGPVRIVVDTGANQRASLALVSFSPSMVLTNLDEMLNLLRYFGEPDWVSRMKAADPVERARLWRDFMQATDPDPTTPENEGLNQYFGRIAVANQRFRDEGVAGWLTDRGEVFVTLGEPDEAVQSNPANDLNGRIVRWTYVTYRLQLFFVDVTGFGGRFRLTPSARADFLRVANQVQRAAREQRTNARRPPRG